MNRKLLIYSLFGIVLYLGILFLVGSSFADFFKAETSFSVQAVSDQTDAGNELLISGTGFDDNTRVAVSADVGNQRAIVGTVPLLGNAIDLLLAEDYALVANTQYGLQILAMGDSPVPVVLTTVSGASSAVSIQREADLLFLSCGQDGVEIYKLGQTGGFLRIGTAGIYGKALASQYANGILYVASGDRGVQIIEINQTSPESNFRFSPRNIIKTPGKALDIVLSGTTLYVATDESGLMIYDVSVPESPELLTSIQSRGQVRTFTLDEGTVFLGDDAGYVSIVDVRDLTAPQRIGEISIGGRPEQLVLSDDLLYLADSVLGLVVLDIQNPAAPSIDGIVDTPGQARAISLRNNHAYVAINTKGLILVDLDKVTQRHERNSVALSRSANEMLMDGNWLYVTTRHQLQVVERSRQGKMELVATEDFQSYHSGLLKRQDHLYLPARREGLRVVAVADPLRPRQVAQLDLPGSANNLVGHGDLLFVASLSAGVNVVDISKPDSPWLVKTLEVPGKVRDVATDGKYLYVATMSSGLQIYRLIDGREPVWFDEIKSQWPLSGFTRILSLQLRDGFLYLASAKDGLQVVDVRDPEKIEMVGRVSLPDFSYKLYLDGDMAYVVSTQSGLSMVDIFDPYNPVNLGLVLHKSGMRDAIVVEDSLLFTAQEKGVLEIERPRELMITDRMGSDQLRVEVPESLPQGWYNLHVSQGEETQTIYGAFSL